MRSKTAALLVAAIAVGIGFGALTRSPSADDRTADAVRQLDTPTASESLRRKEEARRVESDRIAWLLGVWAVAIVAEVACRMAGLGRRPNTDPPERTT